MNPERPDLSGVAPDVLAYIQSLEQAKAALEAQLDERAARRPARVTAPPPAEEGADVILGEEAPTSVNVVTISAGNAIKRTPRHLYSRQSRGGMGVFDLDTPPEEPPVVLALAEEEATLLLFTNGGRSYRLALNRLTASPVRARGTDLTTLLSLRPDEHIIAALPEAPDGDYVALLSERGWVSTVRRSFLGRNMIPGVSFHDAEARGPLVAACWFSEGSDLLVATRAGQGIRFAGHRVARNGGLGIDVGRDDLAVTIAEVRGDDLLIFLLSGDGKGTIRAMSGFRANKNPGGSGKTMMKTDHLVAASAVTLESDVFAISHNSKLIRFPADEVPVKSNPVQGVNCMALRSDVTVALAVTS